MSFIHLIKKVKHWNLDIIGYWVIAAGCWIEKDLEHSPKTFRLFKRFLKIIVLAYIYQLVKSDDLMSCGSKDVFKNHNVTKLVNHEIVKNTKTWIFWEWNTTFLQNKKILNLHLRRHNLKGYQLAAKVNFRGEFVTLKPLR